MYNKEELTNLLRFLERVETKGLEAYALVGLYEKTKYIINELDNPSKAMKEEKDEKVDIR